MYKLIIIIILAICATSNGVAQIAPSFRMPQYSISAFQPTALPYNQFDKIDGQERGNNKPSTKSYFNLSTRLSWLKNWQSGSNSADKAVFESTVLTFDYMKNHDFSVQGNGTIGLKSKLGLGIMQHKWEGLQMNIPFAHATLVLPLGTDADDAANWRIAAGAGVRYSAFNTTTITYLHPNDPDIQIARLENNAGKLAIAVSAAVFNIKNFYLGMGYNRLFDGFTSTPSGSFNELNLLAQYAYGKAKGESGDTKRSLFSHHHSSLVAYKLIGNYPLYAQLNHRFTLQDNLWLGAGIGGNDKDLDKWQIQLGWVTHKDNADGGKPYEWHTWFTLNWDSGIMRQHGVELSGGIFF